MGKGGRPSAADVPDLYQRNAAAWDAARAGGDFFERPVIDRFAAGLPPGGSVLDIGCGSGAPVAAYLIERGFAVTGVDAAPALAALCAQRYPAGEWIAADMRTLDLGRRFDGLIAWNSFFHLSQDAQRDMIGRFGAHAAPGAMLLFTCGHGLGEAIGTFNGEALYHASLERAEYDELLAAAGFETVALVEADPECGEATWRLARMRG